VHRHPAGASEPNGAHGSEREKLVLAGLEALVVEPDEGQRGRQGHALVAVQEGMALREVKQIRGRHFGE
jgi:hypothetical protein